MSPKRERAELDNRPAVFLGHERQEQPSGWGKVVDSQGWEFSWVSAVIPVLPLGWAAHKQPMWPLGSVRRHRYPNGNVGQVIPVTQLLMLYLPSLQSPTWILNHLLCSILPL